MWMRMAWVWLVPGQFVYSGSEISWLYRDRWWRLDAGIRTSVQKNNGPGFEMVARRILIELFWAKQLHWGSACFRCFEDFPVLNFNGCGNVSRESHLAGDVRMLHFLFCIFLWWVVVPLNLGEIQRPVMLKICQRFRFPLDDTPWRQRFFSDVFLHLFRMRLSA